MKGDKQPYRFKRQPFVQEEEWMDRAACRGLTEVFFPRSEVKGWAKDDDYAAAKAICEGCPVRSECIRYVLHPQRVGGVWDFGVWGGMDRRERKRARAEMKRKLA